MAAHLSGPAQLSGNSAQKGSEGFNPSLASGLLTELSQGLLGKERDARFPLPGDPPALDAARSKNSTKTA